MTWSIMPFWKRLLLTYAVGQTQAQIFSSP